MSIKEASRSMYSRGNARYTYSINEQTEPNYFRGIFVGEMRFLLILRVVGILFHSALKDNHSPILQVC